MPPPRPHEGCTPSFNAFPISPSRKPPLAELNLTGNTTGTFDPNPWKEGKKMKISMMGLFPAAILMVLAGVGIGIAQAGEDQYDKQV